MDELRLPNAMACTSQPGTLARATASARSAAGAASPTSSSAQHQATISAACYVRSWTLLLDLKILLLTVRSFIRDARNAY